MDTRSLKNQVRAVPEALGTGLGTMLAPKGAPGTKKIPKGPSPFPPPAPSWELFGLIFPLFSHVIYYSFFQFLKIIHFW